MEIQERGPILPDQVKQNAGDGMPVLCEIEQPHANWRIETLSALEHNAAIIS
jgi:hypothetical protein